ncbi:MAG: DUF2061 domain-containing protein [Gammaproteobacteria bacterium]|jgi:uncharacterized membrane protein
MVKTVTFAALHFSIAFTVSYLLTGDALVGSAIALVEPAVNTVAFHFHEKAWRKIDRRGACRNRACNAEASSHDDSLSLSIF